MAFSNVPDGCGGDEPAAYETEECPKCGGEMRHDKCEDCGYLSEPPIPAWMEDRDGD